MWAFARRSWTGSLEKTQGCPNCGPHKKYPSNSFALNESRNAIHGHNGPNSCLTQPYRTGRIFPSAEICLCERVVLLGCLAICVFPSRRLYLLMFLLLFLSYSSSTTQKSMSWSMRPLRKWSPPWSQRYSQQPLSRPLLSRHISQHWDLAFCPFLFSWPSLRADSLYLETLYPLYQRMLLCPKLLIVACAKGVCACHANMLLCFTVCSCSGWGCCPNSHDNDEGTFFSSILSFTVSIFTFIPLTHPFPGSHFVLNV